MILQAHGFTANCRVITTPAGAHLSMLARDANRHQYVATSAPGDPPVSCNDTPDDHVDWFYQQICLRAATQCSELADYGRA